MAVVPGTLLQPLGHLEPGWFVFGGESPSDPAQLERKVLEWLEAYVLDGEVKVAGFTHMTDALKDEAAAAWAYHRAFDFLDTQWKTQVPAQMNVNLEGGRSFLASQVAQFSTKAGEWRAQYDQLVALPARVETGVPRSAATPANFVW